MTTINRKELHKKVWETPITRLSKEYGLSDVGFAKICKKHNIPRPPRGYWARKATGQSQSCADRIVSGSQEWQNTGHGRAHRGGH